MKTKKKRLFIIFGTLCVIVFLCIFSSQVFKLKTVEVNFYNGEETKVVNIKNNLFFNTPDKINTIISSTKFDYGNLVFLIDKSSYISSLEQKNPYLKLKNIEIKFPNKLIVNASERKPLFYISTKQEIFVLDSDLKLLEISNVNNINLNNLIKFSVNSQSNEEIGFFDFFNVLPSIYEAGQNLKENNIVLNAISNMPIILQKFLNGQVPLSKFSKNIIFQEQSSGIVNLKIVTVNSSYGITLTVENIFKNFDYKLNKLLNSFNTLKKAEPIKTSYGELKIDNSNNCYWNNL